MLRSALLLLFAASLAAQSTKLAVRVSDPGEHDRAELVALGVGLDARSLRAYLMPGESSQDWQRRVVGLLHQLDSASAEERNRAFYQLLEEGAAVYAVMDELGGQPRSAEARLRWRQLRGALNQRATGRPAAIRQLVTVDGEACRGILFELLERPEDQYERAALCDGLRTVGLGEVDGVLATLEGLLPAAQADVLGVWNALGMPVDEGLRPYLASEHGGVRLEAARIFCQAGDAAALPVLVELLKDPVTARRVVAADLLGRNTEGGPPYRVYGSEVERIADVEGWKTWLRAGGTLTPQPAVRELPNGESLICDFMNARVMRIDKDGEILWTIDGLRGACHVRQLHNGNLLVAAAHAGEVIEFDAKQQRVWSYTPELAAGVSEFLGCAERMPNGHTMVLIIGWTTNNSRILEVTPGGEVVRRIDGLTKVDDADLLPDGRLLLTETGVDRVRIIDWEGRESWSVSTSDPREADLLPNGNVLVADGEAGSVLEIDPEGNVVWGVYNLVEPHEADRLANGNTTVCDAEANTIVEMTPDKRVIWRFSNLDHPDDHDRTYDSD